MKKIKISLLSVASLSIAMLMGCEPGQHAQADHGEHSATASSKPMDHSKHNMASNNTAPDAMLSYARPTPDFSLTDQGGQLQNQSMLKGQWQILFFGFTSCPSVCPETLATLQAANHKMAGQLPKVVLISVDPETDTPAQLKAYLSNYQIQSTGLTGPIEQIRQFSHALFLPLSEQANPQHGGLDHSGKVVVVNPNAEVVAYLEGRQPVDEFADKLGKILAQHTGKAHKKI